MIASLTLLAAITLVQPAPPQGASHYYLCSTRDAGRKVGYVSSIFADKPGDLTAVEAGWKQMLTSKYGTTSFPSASCQEAATSAGAESARAKLNDFMSDEGEKITTVAWSYRAPAGKGAPPPSAATPSPFAADAENAKGWCEYNMPQIRSLFTCDCFAKMVLHHRETHPNEIDTQHGESRLIPFQNLMVGTPSRLDCKECMTDEHIASWVTHMMEQGKIVQQRTGHFSQAAYDTKAACLRAGFKKRILAEPYVDRVIPFYNQAEAECSGSRP